MELLITRAGKAGRTGAEALAGALVVAMAVASSSADVPTVLAIPGRANAHVSMAADGRFVAVVWSASVAGGATDVYSAVSRDAGATFSVPVRVNSTPGDARLNGEQPPRVALIARETQSEIAVIWTTRGPDGTLLMTARSVDRGERSRHRGASAEPRRRATAAGRRLEPIGTAPPTRRGSITATWPRRTRPPAPAAATRTTGRRQRGSPTA